MAQAPRDDNRVACLLGTSNADGSTPIPVYADSVTNRLLVEGTLSLSNAKEEDTAHVSGDDGVMALAVRQDTQEDFGEDGDYVPFSIDASGALRVTGGGGGTEYTEDVATPAAIVGNATMVERDDALSSLTPIEGDWASLRCSAEGALWTQDFNSDAMLTALQLIDDAVAAEGSALGKGVLIQGDDGTDRTNVLVDTDGHLQVDILSGASGGTAYTEDEATANPIVGTATMMERDDALSSLTPIEGDWASLRCSAEGALWVQDFNSDAILADTTAIKTAVEILDNAIDGSEMQVDVVAALPAGTNNIGDVDVLTLPTSIQGPGNPTIDSLQHVAINLAAGANQVLVSSAASKQIWVYGVAFTVNVAGTVSFQDEDDAAISGIMNFAASGGMTMGPSGNFAMPIWKLGTDKDLEVDVVTSEIDGFLTYALVSV